MATGTAEFTMSGPFNGTGEPDKSGSYLRIAIIPTGHWPVYYLISIGDAEVLVAQTLKAIQMAEAV